MMASPDQVAWHALPLHDVLQSVQAEPEVGLSAQEAEDRLRRYGPNRLPQQPPPPWWQILWRQFLNPLIYVLAFAAVFALLIGDFTDAGFIAFVLALNAVIGGYQEWKAEQSTRALQKLLRIRALVLRGGELREVDAEQLVPGDVISMESGHRVPADARLIFTQGLEVDESLLTGESLPVQKRADWIGTPQTAVADRLNMVYAGTIVSRGRAKAAVVATGAATVVGQLALDVLSARGGQAPLVYRMERFSRMVAIAIVAAAAIVAALAITFYHSRYQIFDMVLFAVALAVSAIPEGLPAALTVALSVAAVRMAHRGVIVRRLAAVEGLGSCTFIASDKTGTLTANELTVREIRFTDETVAHVTGEGFVPRGEILIDGQPVEDFSPLHELLRAVVLCNEADLHHRDGMWVWHGDPTDVALLTLGQKAGLDRSALLSRYPRIHQIPYESEQQFAASFHQVEGRVRVFVKGAPERVLTMCGQCAGVDPAGRLPADSPLARKWLSVAEEMASRGLRVLAVAVGDAPEDLSPDTVPAQPQNLTLLGLVGMIDPLRPEVPAAIRTCREAGIEVCMVTGDHPVTALAIARELGLASSPAEVMSGQELEHFTQDDLANVVDRIRVFARVAPKQKLALVQAAQRAGHFVAVTGDGVNDAPALRAANIGVAMGKSGTDVAREAADLVISDDNFATIVAGVEEGRVAYDNVRKVIYLLVSCGAAELVALGGAVALGMPMPLLPIQILWLNVVTNGIQGVALAFEPNEGGVLRRKPRPPQEPIFNKLMIERTVLAALAMGIVMLATFGYLLNVGWPESTARNALLLLMVLFENIHIGNCRSETKSAFVLSPLRSPFLLSGAILAFLIHVATMYIPLGQKVLETQPVSITTWVGLIGLALTILLVMELHKAIWWWRHRKSQVNQTPARNS